MTEDSRFTAYSEDTGSTFADEAVDMTVSFVADVAKKVADHILAENRITLDEIRERVANAVLSYEIQRRHFDPDFPRQAWVDILQKEIERQQQLFLKSQKPLTAENFFSQISLEERIQAEIQFIIQEMNSFRPELVQSEQIGWYDQVGPAIVDFFRSVRNRFSRRKEQ